MLSSALRGNVGNGAFYNFQKRLLNALARNVARDVAVYNHYKRINHLSDKSDDAEVEIEKSNILLLGPTCPL